VDEPGQRSTAHVRAPDEDTERNAERERHRRGPGGEHERSDEQAAGVRARDESQCLRPPRRLAAEQRKQGKDAGQQEKSACARKEDLPLARAQALA
jgi:hypothetical protein